MHSRPYNESSRGTMVIPRPARPCSINTAGYNDYFFFQSKEFPLDSLPTKHHRFFLSLTERKRVCFLAILYTSLTVKLKAKSVLWSKQLHGLSRPGLKQELLSLVRLNQHSPLLGDCFWIKETRIFQWLGNKQTKYLKKRWYVSIYIKIDNSDLR